jgi:hypothetical protein
LDVANRRFNIFWKYLFLNGITLIMECWKKCNQIVKINLSTMLTFQRSFQIYNAWLKLYRIIICKQMSEKSSGNRSRKVLICQNFTLNKPNRTVNILINIIIKGFYIWIQFYFIPSLIITWQRPNINLILSWYYFKIQEGTGQMIL